MKLLKKMKNKHIITLLFCLFGTATIFAQFEKYQYMRPIENVKETWHELELPDDIYGKLNRQYADLRILNLTPEKDTLEVPYLLNLNAETITKDAIPFEQLNQTQNANSYFFTFEMKNKKAINQILLNFQNENFDWKIALEGSQNQKEWFTVLEDYRLVSFKNRRTNYSFTELNFPNAQYTFFRLKIPASEAPKLIKASIYQYNSVPGKFRQVENLPTTITDDKNEKETVLEIILPEVLPVFELTLPVKTDYDFYRKILIQELSDSTVTANGTQYYYKTIHRDVLSSLEKKEFKFKATRTQRLKVTIENKDNQPLEFGNPSIKSAVYSLTARFNEKGDFQLLYGNERALKPQYDLAQFASTIPEKLPLLTLGKETKRAMKTPDVVEPIFANPIWLWVIMGVIILLLGGFTFKMMTSEKMK